MRTLRGRFSYSFLCAAFALSRAPSVRLSVFLDGLSGKDGLRFLRSTSSFSFLNSLGKLFQFPEQIQIGNIEPRSSSQGNKFATLHFQVGS